MNHLQRFPVRKFSALSKVIPVSRLRTSGETHPLVAWNAAVDLASKTRFHGLSAGRQLSGASMSEPPAAQGTTVPSMALLRGGPPHAL